VLPQDLSYSLIGYFIAVEIDLLRLFFQRAGLIIAAILVVLFVTWQFWKRRNRHARRSSQRVQQKSALQ
jgi:membrane protein DedA with SNARE-associated domain